MAAASTRRRRQRKGAADCGRRKPFCASFVGVRSRAMGKRRSVDAQWSQSPFGVVLKLKAERAGHGTNTEAG